MVEKKRKKREKRKKRKERKEIVIKDLKIFIIINI